MLCLSCLWICAMCAIFLFNATATPEIYTSGHTLSLRDALPISGIDLQWCRLCRRERRIGPDLRLRVRGRTVDAVRDHAGPERCADACRILGVQSRGQIGRAHV